MRPFLQKLLVLAVASTAFAADAVQPTMPPDPSDHLGIEMNIVPVDGQPGVFVASATMTDLDSERIVGTPRMTFSTSHAASVEIGVEGRWLLHVAVSADADAKVATYEALFTRSGKVTSRQRVAVRLNG